MIPIELMYINDSCHQIARTTTFPIAGMLWTSFFSFPTGMENMPPHSHQAP